MRHLGAVLGQGLVVVLLRRLRVQAQVELVLPAEVEARLGKRIVARAVLLIEEKEEIARNRIIKEWDGHEVQVLNGRFGPYISDGKLNGKIPKDREPASLTLEETLALLAETGKPARRGFGAKKAAAKKVVAKKAPAEKKPAKKAARKAVAKKAAKKAVKKTAAKKAVRPLSGDIETAKPLLTPAKVEVGKKRIVKKPARDDAPF